MKKLGKGTKDDLRNGLLKAHALYIASHGTVNVKDFNNCVAAAFVVYFGDESFREATKNAYTLVKSTVVNNEQN